MQPTPIAARRQLKRRVTHPVIVPVVALALISACSGDDGSTAASASSSSAPVTTTVPADPSTTPAAATTTTATATATAAPSTSPMTTDAAATTTVASTLDQPADASCLIGDWTISDAELDAYFDVVAGNASFDSIDNDGVMRLTFSADTFEWIHEFTIVMVVDGVQYEGVVRGGTSGTYIQTDDALTAVTSEIVDGESDLTSDGQPVALDAVGDLFVNIVPARPMDELPYSCNGPSLVLDAGPIEDAQHVVTLTAA